MKISATVICLLGLIVITFFSVIFYEFAPEGAFLWFSPAILLLISLIVSWIRPFVGGTLLLIVSGLIDLFFIILFLNFSGGSGNSDFLLIMAFIIVLSILLSGILFRKAQIKNY